MSSMVCPHCHEPLDIFARVPPERSIWALDVDRLGEVPFVPDVSKAGDTGQPVMVAQPRSAQAEAFRGIARRVAEKI